MSWGTITDEGLRAAAALIGTPLRRTRMQRIDTTTRDAIRHFAWGVGDDNRLWLEEDYAALSPAGTLVTGMTALPCRQNPLAAASMLGLAGNNRAIAYATHGLDLLGVGAASDAHAVRVVLAGDIGETELIGLYPHAECVIRVWDFQVGMAGSGVLASAVAGAATVIGHAAGAGTALPVDMPEKWCSAYGVILALAEVWRRRQSGCVCAPSHYDVSAADVLRAFALQNAGSAAEAARMWRRNGRVCVDHGGIFPMGFFACKDGHVAILGRSRRDWRQIRQAIGEIRRGRRVRALRIHSKSPA